MGWEAWFTLGVLGLVFGLLALTRLTPDLVLIGGVLVLLVAHIISPDEALSGLSNEGMVTVAVLFIVGAGVRETGGVAWLAERLFGRPKSSQGAILRMMLPTTTLSAFMNNTPLVAMLIPAVADWGKQYRIPVSKLMLPLSYAAILGGTCTLIGTSTNLVVNGLVIAKKGLPGLGMFDITWIGVPCAIAGCAYIAIFSRWLLPDRSAAIGRLDDPREYTVEMLVSPDSPLSGKTIEQANLRHLSGVYLAEIERKGFVLPAVSPQERLWAGDRLVFVGIVDSVVDLQKIRGLVPATDQVFKLAAPRSERCLIEAVVSTTCPLVGKTIRDGRFRSIYHAVVIAVARHGERIQKKIGDIVLRAGDTLLLEGDPSFVEQHRNSRAFFLVSRLENSNPPRHDRALLAMGILAAMVVVAGMGWLPMLQAAMLAAAVMLLTRCCGSEAARRSIDWQVLLAIAASFGIAHALEKTGAAHEIAGRLINMAGGNPWGALAVVYAVTLVVTEIITNNAAAALMFPMALATAKTLDVSFMPFVIVVMMAASAGFATPIGYQTNLMVYGPGGYRFSDYVKMGVPLDILIGVVAVAITPWVWPF
ncbi:MAG: SLC13 family permease [Pirellulales bacterium]